MAHVVFRSKFSESATNPARCFFGEDLIEVNRSVFERLTPYQQRFVLLHEEGHLANNNKDEVAADRFALERLALKSENSLFDYVKSIDRIALSDERKRQARLDALKIAAKAGSKEAADVLGYANAEDDGTNEPDGNNAACVILVLLILIIFGIWIKRK